MPERLKGRDFLRASAALSLALGSAIVSVETNSEEQVEAEPREIKAMNFSLAIPVDLEPIEVTTTTTVPTTTTTQPPPTTSTTEAPEPPPTEVSGAPAEWMAAAGIPSENYDEVDYIMSRESGWVPSAQNDGGCIGLGQNCPDASGNYWLDDACPNWQNDPVCQLQRFQEYAYGRYGGWDGAAAHSSSAGWW